ncbi:MAG: hypothetical protein SPI86_01075 [Treponemataceae bacterium]|nr:hypothetical protein [Spirochaetales bacterium]MDY6030332.1 hypothetical protein [Treponemataceae bacterium]
MPWNCKKIKVGIERIYKDFLEYDIDKPVDVSENLETLVAQESELDWDFFDAIRWALGAKQHHGSKILFDSSSGEDCSQVKLTIVDENEKETIITRKFSKDGGEELISDASLEEILRLQTYLKADDDKNLIFGTTKIVVANDDKQLAMQADGMIGITTDENGESKAFGIEREKE